MIKEEWFWITLSCLSLVWIVLVITIENVAFDEEEKECITSTQLVHLCEHPEGGFVKCDEYQINELYRERGE